MDLGDLYYRAVDIVQDNADQQWVKDLMKFWKDETPGLTDNRPSKRRRVAATDDSGTDDDMDDFFGDDTAAADQHDEENETRSRTLNQSNPGGPQNDAPPTPPRSSPTPGSSPAPPHTGSPAPPRTGSPARTQRELSPLSDPPTTPAPVGRKTKRAAPVPRGGGRGRGKARSRR
ncbi:hypothetical protein DFJ58DRAFT_918104 [Suillus subalutaceus]|uniref:uncharacterized protein n=1 Tax=Suillus subalutaceus TaxID=48586 RepID=UPI001B865B05|nr:uncharacterized protein DFJ58DRAFT_918104 [Suillus subalutaceus]KAG1833249.1 hypothetical protein DFJ58DRAFT_918104 [Suillus subalutaceus]